MEIVVKGFKAHEGDFMSWDGEKIKDLRLRMGWSQSDLARRLQIQSEKIGQLEMNLEVPEQNILENLDLLFRQAEASADFVSCESLAEIIFEESDAPQIDTSSIRSKFNQ